MIEFQNLAFGDVVYRAKETNNAFSKKKITQTDADGITWHRYNMDHWTYVIEEIVYCGKVTHIQEGEVRFDKYRDTEYHFKYPDGKIYHEWEGDDTDRLCHWFHTRAEAETYIDERKKTREE